MTGTSYTGKRNADMESVHQIKREETNLFTYQVILMVFYVIVLALFNFLAMLTMI